MKKIFIIALAAVMLVSLIPFSVSASTAVTGKGAPSGSHFNLNIIGVQHEKLNDESGGNRIFVPLNTTGRNSKTGLANSSDILLTAGNNFYVIDDNATDADNSAEFQMPSDVATTYEVYVVGLGKPGGNADMQLWAYDPSTGTWVYNLNKVTISHVKNGKFVKVTSDLLTINGTPVFSTLYEDYLWTYTNNGQKLVQLRFYPVTN